MIHDFELQEFFYSPKNMHLKPYCTYILWQYGFWSFLAGGTKLERFLPKNQHTQRKLLNFENWVNGCQKVPKFDFQSQFFMSKVIRIFLNFFFIEEYQFRSTFFDNINF